MAIDKRSNRCKRCGGTYTSRKHQRQCKPTSRRRSARTSSGMGRRTMGEILASASTNASSTVYAGIPVSADFYTQEPAHG